MLVALDVFSGRPNPTWYLPPVQARDFVAGYRAARARAAAQALAVGPTPSRLGFRGFTLRQSEPGELPGPTPADMRVCAPETAPGRDELQMARYLLSTAKAAVDDDVAAAVSQIIDDLEKESDAPSGTARSGGDLDLDRDADIDDGLAAALATEGCPERLSPMMLPFWATPFVQPYNNCYNYATNFVSGTLAQPGRRSGQMYSSFGCDRVLSAAIRDGLLIECEADAGVVALGIWPGIDFHWWRLHPGGFWAHKIGRSPPQTVDNSNRVIAGGLTPATCDRGPYVEFCGFFFVPAWMWVA